MSGTMQLTLKVWRQKNQSSGGNFETYQAKNISSEMLLGQETTYTNRNT